MNPLQLMEFQKPKFTPNDLLIYETITKNPTHIVRMTTSSLAEECGVSQPALSRFVKSLGYNRYQDFRADLIAWLSKQTEQETDGSHQLAYFRTVHQLLDQIEQVLTADYMQEISQYILSFERVFTTGAGKSYHPAELFEILTRKTMRYSHAVRRDMLQELSDFLNKDDLLIVFSVSAKPYIMEDICGTNGKIMLVTANASHNYKDIVDREVLLPYILPDPEASAVSPVLFDMFVEMLVPQLFPKREN